MWHKKVLCRHVPDSSCPMRSTLVLGRRISYCWGISSLGKKSLINDNIAAPSAQLCVRMNHLLHRVNAILAFWYSSSRRWFSSKRAFYSSSLGRWFYSKQLVIIGNVLQLYHSDVLLLFSESLFKSTLRRLPREGKAINWEFYHHTSVKWCTPVETIL